MSANNDAKEIMGYISFEMDEEDRRTVMHAAMELGIFARVLARTAQGEPCGMSAEGIKMHIDCVFLDPVTSQLEDVKRVFDRAKEVKNDDCEPCAR